jgi:beta-galactosidase
MNLLAENGSPKLILWRAFHRDDDSWANNEWEKYGLKNLKDSLIEMKVESVDKYSTRVISTSNYKGKEGFAVKHTVTYVMKGDGSVKVNNKVEFVGPRINLARIGVRFLLDKKLDQMTYFGRGPAENYADRKDGSDIGVYQLNVNAQYEYEKPMEHGNHEDVRWVQLSGKDFPTLSVKADENLMQVSSLMHTDEQMNPVEYKIDLPASTATVFTVSTKTLGVGSSACGPRPLSKYLIWSDNTEFSYTLQLLLKK